MGHLYRSIRSTVTIKPMFNGWHRVEYQHSKPLNFMDTTLAQLNLAVAQARQAAVTATQNVNNAQAAIAAYQAQQQVAQAQAALTQAQAAQSTPAS